MALRRPFSFIVVILFLCSLAVTSAGAVSITQVNRRLISESAILIDADTGQILFEKDMHRVLRPASITKVMTALLALENGELSDTITVSRAALRPIPPDAYKVPFLIGEEITLEQAMYANAMVSAADASNCIAEYIGGTVDNFIELMNERAKELGALNTTFLNAHGMPDDGHLTTAYDMAQIARAAVSTPGFNEIFSTHRYVMPPTNVQQTQRVFRNQNRMMTGAFVYEDLIAGKTGWTGISQYTLFTAARRDDRTLICIVMRSPKIDDKYKDTTMLLDYGFDEFKRVDFPIEELENYSFGDTGDREMNTEFVVYEAFSCLIPKSLSKDDIKVEYITEDGDVESELLVRIVFTLDAPGYWQGVPELGEVTGAAQIIKEVVDDDTPDSDEELTDPEEFPRPEWPVVSVGPPELPPVIEGQTDDNANIYDQLYELSSGWFAAIKDAVVVLVVLAIAICCIIVSKRKLRFDRNRSK